MRCFAVWIIVFVLAVSLASPVLEASDDLDYVSLLDRLDADRAWGIVNDLAGDRFEGRRSGTRAADLASEYIADYFDSIGLKPAGEGGTYRTKFDVPLWQLTQMPRLALLDARGNRLKALEYRRDFYVQPGSGAGNYSADVIFGGYGITANSLGYDDYANTSTRGKIVLAIIGTPPFNRFEGENYGTWYSKAENAMSHGAVGLILVDSPAEPTPHYIERWRGGWTIYRNLVILGASIEMADELLKDTGLTLSSVQRTIDQDLKPQSSSLNRQLHVSVEVSFTEIAEAYNVLGFIPGSDPTASKKAVIIGAHYDHWGKDVDGQIFRGANDDASGVAVMMEIARVFSAAVRPRWSVLFAAWSGEEECLCGSYAYVGSPSFPLEETVAYLNLDMVGYGRQLLCEVSEAHKELRTVVTESAEQLGISFNLQGFSGSSDQVPFEEKRVQNLMFIYWPDEFYHTPADTADRVSTRKLLETARLTALTTLELAEVMVMKPTTTSALTSAQFVNQVFTIDALLIVGVAFTISAAAGAFHFRRRKQLTCMSSGSEEEADDRLQRLVRTRRRESSIYDNLTQFQSSFGSD